MLEWWNTGILEYWGRAQEGKNQIIRKPFGVCHYSIIPLFHYSSFEKAFER